MNKNEMTKFNDMEKSIEVWKQIPNSHFSVSKKGRMINNKQNIILPQSYINQGYLCYSYKTRNGRGGANQSPPAGRARERALQNTNLL